MDFDYLGAELGNHNKGSIRLVSAGLFTFLKAMEERGTVSRALRDELMEVVKMMKVNVVKRDDPNVEKSDKFYFAVDGAMVVSRVADVKRTPVGFLTKRQFFFDEGSYLGSEGIRFLLCPLKVMMVYYIEADVVLGMIHRHKTFGKLVRLVSADVDGMVDMRREILALPRKDRIGALYERHPHWLEEVSATALSSYLDMGSTYHHWRRIFEGRDIGPGKTR